MDQNKLKHILSAILYIPVATWVIKPADEPPKHTVKYQTDGTIHLLADNSITKEDCLALLKHYRYQATHQIGVYKKSTLTNTEEPWCVVNKMDSNNPNPFFNDTLFNIKT